MSERRVNAMALQTGGSAVPEELLNELAMTAVITHLNKEVAADHLKIYAVSVGKEPYKFKDEHVDGFMIYLDVPGRGHVGETFTDFDCNNEGDGYPEYVYEYKIARKPLFVHNWQAYGLPDPVSQNVKSWMVLGKQNHVKCPTRFEEPFTRTGRSRMLVVGTYIE